MALALRLLQYLQTRTGLQMSFPVTHLHPKTNARKGPHVIASWMVLTNESRLVNITDYA